MEKILIVFIILGILLVGILIFNSNKDVKKVYQGPVRIGDDENYFRETGITKKINFPDWNGVETPIGDIIK